MKEITLSVEVLEELESSLVVKMRNGFGDPIIRVYKDSIKIKDAPIVARKIGLPFVHDCLVYIYHAWMRRGDHVAIFDFEVLGPSCTNAECSAARRKS